MTLKVRNLRVSAGYIDWKTKALPVMSTVTAERTKTVIYRLSQVPSPGPRSKCSYTLKG